MLATLALAAGCSAPPAGPDGATTDVISMDTPGGDSEGPDGTPPDAGYVDARLRDAAAPDASPIEPRLVVLSREGAVASLALAAPYAPRATSDLHASVASARCAFGRCVVAHPSPTDALSVVSAADLAVVATIPLGDGADPRDVAIVDARTLVVSEYGRAALRVVDLETRATTAIDLTALADADGLAEPGRLAVCGRRVYAQLRRLDHTTGAPSSMPAALAVIDLDRPDGQRVVDADPVTPGVQAIALARRPAFDMPVDCAAGVLHVAEPAPVLQGGSGYEEVDLAALTARPSSLAASAEAGGFEVVGPQQYWLITHTEFGPGPSSHLNYTGSPTAPTHNTFSREHVDDLAYDAPSDAVFYPDPCATIATNPGCVPGVHVFRAHVGTPSIAAVDVGFAPIELAVSR